MDTIELKNISKVFTTHQSKISVLNNAFFIFEQGKTYGLLGPSGIGKSTLMHIISGIDEPTSGTIFYNQKNINDLSNKEKAEAIRFVTQSPHMIKELTVYENCFLAGKIFNQSHEEIKEQLEMLFKEFGFIETMHWNVGQLSRGQFQRAALIRALITRPTFLLADEPTGNLDETTGKDVLTILMGYQKKWGMGLIISSHNKYVIDQMEVVFTIKDGSLVPIP